jgi:flavin-binding protein dodecin
MRFDVLVVDLHSDLSPNNRWSGFVGQALHVRIAFLAATLPYKLFVFDFGPGKNACMSDHIYKKIELVGSSPKGMEDAVKNALARAKKTVRNMRWFEVAETRGYLEEGNIAHWQVTLKVGFTLED